MRLLKYLILSASLFTIFSCSNEIELAGPYKNIPVIYGFLDYKQDTNFIRVNKAFLGNGNALVYAQEHDSIYYDSLHVYLLRYSGNTKADSIVLFKTVNAELKDSGIFAYKDNILYATTKTLLTNSEYELHVRMPKWNQSVSARIKICGPIQFTSPFNLSTPVRFENGTNNPPSYTIRWTIDQNSKSYQLALRFNYYEWPLNDPSNQVIKSVYREFSSFIGSTQINNNNIIFPITKGDFYSTLVSGIEPDPNVARSVKDIDFKVFQGGEELQKYVEINAPTTGLVTKVGSYTNLSGDALGLFSSKTSFETKGYKFDKNTIDSIVGGQYTSNLGFTFSN